MNVQELVNDDFGNNAQETDDNTIAQRKLGDHRKPVITLASLGKLRRLKELKKFQEYRRNDLAKLMYGVKDEPSM